MLAAAYVALNHGGLGSSPGGTTMKHDYKYRHIDGKGWIGVIFEDTPPPKNVVAVGRELSERDKDGVRKV